MILLIARIWDEDNAILVLASIWRLRTWPAFLKRARFGRRKYDAIRGISNIFVTTLPTALATALGA